MSIKVPFPVILDSIKQVTRLRSHRPVSFCLDNKPIDVYAYKSFGLHAYH